MTNYEVDNDFLEKRLRLISSLNSELSKLREDIKNDQEVRSLYTNRSIHKKYIEMYGEESPPLLLRQHNNTLDKDITDLFEAQSNISLNYSKQLSKLCTFSFEELKYIVSNKSNLLQLETSVNNIPLQYHGDSLCTLKYCRDELHKDQFKQSGFFLTRFIFEDDIIPLFDTFKCDGEKCSVYLQIN
jgi:hypothetical protein